MGLEFTITYCENEKKSFEFIKAYNEVDAFIRFTRQKPWADIISISKGYINESTQILKQVKMHLKKKQTSMPQIVEEVAKELSVPIDNVIKVLIDNSILVEKEETTTIGDYRVIQTG